MTVSSLGHYLASMTSSVSPSIIFQPIVGIPSLLHRYGSRGRYRVVCPSFTPFVTRLNISTSSTLLAPSEITPKGRKSTKLAQTLLNGNNICMVSPVFVQRRPTDEYRLITTHPSSLSFLPFLVGAWERWTRTGIVRW